jgi:hypothetical protein
MQAQVNDLSILLPLPASAAEFSANTIPPSESCVGGPLVPQALHQQVTAGSGQLDYASLRVVSARLDPCFGQRGPITDPSTCHAQLRLVFEPILFEGRAVADDAAVHAFYALSQSEFDATLAQVIALRAANQPAGTASMDLGPLAVHPILKSQGLSGAMARGLRGIICQHAGAARLTRLAMLTSLIFPNALVTGPVVPHVTPAGTWTLGAFDISGGMPTAFVIPTLPDRATSVAFLEDTAATIDGRSAPNSTSPDNPQLLASAQGAAQASASARQSAFNAALRVENPNLHNTDTIDCASCHLAQPGRILVGQRQFGLSAAGNPNAFVANAAFVPAADVAQTTTIDVNNGLNIHAFSYKGQEPMIIQRVINETAAILADIKSRH